MLLRFLSILLLLAPGVFGQTPSLVEKVKAVLTAKPGVILSIKIIQKQFDQSSVERGNFEIVDSGRYIFDSKEESILVDGKMIQTWNKRTRQLIIDEIVEGEFSLFDLLKGDFDQYLFTEEDQKDGKLDFSIPEIGISGSLFVDNPTGIPEKIIVRNGPDQSLEIEINSLKTIEAPGLFSSFNPQPLEVIDLRE
ncbi:MAG: hypothetical protein ACE5D2_06925 [Fidelibacterota bacterium]